MPRTTHRRIAIGGIVALVASIAFIAPDAYASTVTGVTASPTPLTAGASATYTVDFSTSATGALANGVDTITLTGPAGTQFPLVEADYTVNGTALTATPSDSASNNVTITTPVPISSLAPVVVVAGVGATATNTAIAGTYVISVNTSIDASQAASSPGYTIVAGAPSQVVVTSGATQSATVGTIFTNPLSATIEDSHGNPVLIAGTRVTFTAPASGASGIFFNGTITDSATTNASGVATTTPFTADTVAGTYLVTASSVGLSSANFIETNVAGAASQDVVTSGAGQNATVGAAFATSLSTTIEDSHGNPVLVGGTTVSFTAPGSGASGSFANGTDTTIATTNGGGVATATTFTAGTTSGSYLVTASSAGSTSASVTETNVAGAASQVVVSSGTGQNATVGTAFSTSLGATIEDSHGNPVLIGGTAVTFTAPPNGASGTFANGTNATTATTNTSGAAVATAFTADSISGPYTVTAGLAGSTSASFNETNVAGSASKLIGGYNLVAADGGVFGLGGAGFFGSEGGKHLNRPVVAMVVTPNGGGYWLVASDGGIFSFGNAQFYGSEGGKHLNKPIVAMAATSNGGGYWLVASDGGIFSFGNAQFYGSEGGKHLNRPIVGMAADALTGGYWMVASDGGIFSFNAPFAGSTGGIHLNRPIVEMAADPSTGGYWMVASDGGIFTFGGARFYGSEGGKPLNKPIVGMVADRSTGGYWMVASDGGIFSFNAPFSGSLGGTHLSQPIVGMSTQ